jgi:thermopsin
MRFGGRNRASVVLAVVILAGATLLALPGSPVPSLRPVLATPSEVRGAGTDLLAPAIDRGASIASWRTVSAVPAPGASLGSRHSEAPSAGSGVDPFRFYSHEPAPTGIADYGVNTSLDPYAYNTTEFEGTVSVQQLLAESSSSGDRVSFQLNLNLVLTNTTAPYTYDYWIQDVFNVQIPPGGGGDLYRASDEVWNLSQPGELIENNSIEGNGTQQGNYYAYCVPTYPSCNNNFTGTGLSPPFTLDLRAISSVDDGVPTVRTAYALGGNWDTYDTVQFPTAGLAHLTDEGFAVSGYQFNPSNTFRDAEMVYVGQGGGSSQVDQGSHLNLSLSYWNGHNLQATPNAWNFGSDTGETMANVTVSESALSGGHPGAEVRSGTGTLGELYDASQVGTLLVHAPESNGTLLINGTATSYTNGSAALTLAPGTYSIALLGASTYPDRVTIQADDTTTVDLVPASEVVFQQMGLPSGTDWGVTIDGLAGSTSGSSLTLALPNGTYPIAYPPISGFVGSASNPSQVTVPSEEPISIAWVPFTYSVPISETGLPSGTVWWVEANNLTLRGTNATLSVSAPNGSTPFTTGSVYEFVSTPSNGSINVTAGLVVPQSVRFSYRPTYLVGTLTPATAILSIDGTPVPTQQGRFNDTVLPGTHDVVASLSGYRTLNETFVTTPGNVTLANVALNSTGSSSSSSSDWLTGSGGEALVGAAIVVVVIAGAATYVVFRRSRNSRPPS